MGEIAFFSEGVDFDFNQSEECTSWILNALGEEQRILDNISVIFVSDNHLLNINQTYLKHDYLTDVITFDYSEAESISGDIFISVDRVKENAGSFGQSFEHELLRVIIHGVLHLCGYKDKTEEEIDIIRGKEDYYLSLRSF